MVTPRRLLAPLLVAMLLSGCSSDPACGDLAALTAERDEARASFAEVTKRIEAGSASEDELDAAHDVMHDLDTRVHDLAEACA